VRALSCGEAIAGYENINKNIESRDSKIKHRK